MIIKLQDEFKSLQPFVSEELSPFTIITGKNGSGKSQLLNLIRLKNQNDVIARGVRIDVLPNITKIQAEGIEKDNSKIIDHEQWKVIISAHLGRFKSIKPTQKKIVRYILKNNLTWTPSNNQRQLLTTSKEYSELIRKGYSELHNVPIPDNAHFNQERDVLRNFFTKDYIKTLKFVDEVCKFTRKNEEQLVDADFYNTPSHENLIDDDDLFSSQVELIFYNYAKRRDFNNRRFLEQTLYHEKNEAIADPQFVTIFIPPWQTINEILTQHNIDFYFKGIERNEFTVDAPITTNLVKKSDDKIIPFSDLSSGEKVIIGLILKLFTSQYYKESLTFPELLILDEPDAHLHPEMSKLLLDVLEDTFVNKYGIRVIITTHSPSTVALAKEDHIFQLTNGQNTSLRKISKDDALALLTSFIPTLSIDYKSHRQIFVESPTDVTYYRLLHDKHAQNKRLNHRLYFISNSAGEGNSSQVYSIVEQMRESGNNTSYGVVDWDLKNKENNFVFVHGIDEKYSIENFILDPIYIICLLIDNNYAHNILEKTGMTISDNQYNIGLETDELIQRKVEVFFRDFERKYPNDKYDSERAFVEYLNGKKIEIPKWYLHTRGHDIQVKILEVYPALKNKYRNEGDLQNELSKIMSKCYPFVPMTSIDLLERLSN